MKAQLSIGFLLAGSLGFFSDAWALKPVTGKPMVRGISQHLVLFCWMGNKVFKHTNECPLNIHEMGVAKLKAGTIAIPQYRSTLTKVDPEGAGEPCGEARNIAKRTNLKPLLIDRKVKMMGVKSKRYKELIGKASGIKNVPITVLARIDLDGNGTEEVLFEVNSHDNFFVAGPATITSLVGIRYIGKGGVQTKLLHKEIKRLKKGQSENYWHLGSLAGVTDLEGDGKLEIVMTSGYYEGGGASVFRFDGKSVKLVGQNGCGA